MSSIDLDEAKENTYRLRVESLSRVSGRKFADKLVPDDCKGSRERKLPSFTFESLGSGTRISLAAVAAEKNRARRKDRGNYAI